MNEQRNKKRNKLYKSLVSILLWLYDYNILECECEREMLSENKWPILIDYFGKIIVESRYEGHICILSVGEGAVKLINFETCCHFLW